MAKSSIIFLSAVELLDQIKRREVSCLDVTDAHLEQIKKHNDTLNAIVTLVAEEAREKAHAADLALANGDQVGPLHGLPVAHKDLALTKNVRTTFGSLSMKDHIPAENGLLVQRMQDAGAIMLGKTNTPEFGAGSHTFNEVFGATRNPYHPDTSCGGSSGGAAVALASGMVSLADGSDMGGSLRNPAAWCNVVGLRPTPGRVPSWPSGLPLATLPVEGPMARTVEDVALLMNVIAGPDPRCPLSLTLAEQDFGRSLERDFNHCRIAVSADFGGQIPMDPAISDAVLKSARVFRNIGIDVKSATPDLRGADDTFKTLRASHYAAMLGATLDQHRHEYKQTLIWNIEQGLALTANQIEHAEQVQQQIRKRLDEFLDDYEFLLLPVTQINPFAIDKEYPTQIQGEPMHTYLDWMKSCYLLSVPGHPAISVPAGFSARGLPIGLQIVGRYGDDFGVLQLAYAFQQATRIGRQRPSSFN